MSLQIDNSERNQRTLAIAGFAVLVAVASISAILGVVILGDSGVTEAQTVREYNIEVVPKDIDFGGGNVWHAWTYKLADSPEGTVPGPTLKVKVGEKLRVTVTNKLDLVHSFHSHFTNYDITSDGSQLNTITGQGAGAMIPPGESWTYEFEATKAGIYYYHCHSADGHLTISQHIHQGLYGAIIVEDPEEAPVRNEVLFMGEIGGETEGDVPAFIMNGIGLPGGEHKLEEVFVTQGIEAVQAQFNKTVPVYSGRTGEEIRLHVINIGDQPHTWHGHAVSHISEATLGGRQWPANVLPLLPGQADTLRLTFGTPGLWLFHCHVVNHADAGMIGLFIIEADGEETPTQPP
jgi:FtsP/CotA-like multicopper oxidase with cupredoxin domain